MRHKKKSLNHCSYVIIGVSENRFIKGDNMVRYFKHFLYVLLIIALIMATTGCLDSAGDDEQPAREQAREEPVEAASGEALSIVVPDGKSDRLPGSLKWDSITLYSQGLDFLADQENGLHSIKISSQSSTSSSTSGSNSAETGQTAAVESSQETGGGTTSTHSSSAGGISTNVTVDGSMKVTESTTSGSGNQGSSTWWDMDSD
jgi:hypothetical protein